MKKGNFLAKKGNASTVDKLNTCLETAPKGQNKGKTTPLTLAFIPQM